jgi:hypothetical protein
MRIAANFSANFCEKFCRARRRRKNEVETGDFSFQPTIMTRRQTKMVRMFQRFAQDAAQRKFAYM